MSVLGTKEIYWGLRSEIIPRSSAKAAIRTGSKEANIERFNSEFSFSSSFCAVRESVVACANLTVSLYTMIRATAAPKTATTSAVKIILKRLLYF